MFIRDDRVYYSASDLKAAAECEWALLRKLDAKLGRTPLIEEAEDAMLERASDLGNAHERWALEGYRERLGAGVVEIETKDTRADPELLAAAHAETLEALRARKDVVFQATFLEEPPGSRVGFVGFADFLVLDRELDAYEVWDTKLARKARVTALLQLAAYADQLRRLGIPVSPTAVLLLGDRTRSPHRLADIEPVFADRVARLVQLFEERLDDAAPIAWATPGITACGRCEWCTPEVERTHDVLLVAGMRSTQRVRLAAAGIATLEQLAASSGPVDGIGQTTIEKLRAQARMQLDAPPHVEGEPHEVHYEVASPKSLSALPAPDPGDIFFDFEGDPLWTDNGTDWGLDYLWGLVTLEGGEERFHAFWAHDREQEKRALEEFLAFVRERRAAHPGMHIYHYADYERAHLQQLTARYGVGEADLDGLLADDVFVDLYPIVRRSIRISESSYSIKKLEPLYMGAETRAGFDVQKGDESIRFYVEYTEARDDGREADAAEKLEQIRAYNEYDCVSTRRLRDWLLGLAARHDVAPSTPEAPTERTPSDRERAETELRERLYSHVEGVPAAARDADQRAIALAAAAVEYHRREDKTFWAEHFARQKMDPEDWPDSRDVFLVESGQVVVDWHRASPKAQGDSRVVRLHGVLAAGSGFREGSQPYVMYDAPFPEVCGEVKPGYRGEHDKGKGILAVELDGEKASITLDEYAGVGGEGWPSLPFALTPAAPIKSDAQRAAILQWGGAIHAALPQLPPGPALDILRRIPPRLTGGGLEPVGVDGAPAAIAESLLRLDRSYLAVQGPPGSGKTFVGTKVIAHLVTEHRWKIGVVAQSHEVVENLLRRVVEDGVDAELVAKRPQRGGYDEPPPWRVLEQNADVMPFIGEHAATGFVLGGTAWDFANPGKVPRESLDLLVIDEAGQYSLANTIAVSVAARRLLLLGDPQQLPQVTTGTHPEPIDTSALGWLSDGHDVLPAELGYFLAESRRMHPALTRAVSDLSYEGRLRSHEPVTTARRLEGVAPGLHPVPVEHAGCSVESPVEAQRVVELARAHLGRAWRDPSTGRDDAIRPSDIIVVAPYNAQVELIRRALDAAGLDAVPVGTVDKFQGQEAAVAIVSLTASSALDVPRGLGFLLQRNRLNVAVSRAKWAAYLIHSPALRDFLPRTPQALAELSAFIRLTTPGAPDAGAAAA